MAIKLIQGLIDVGGNGSGSSQKVNSDKENRGGNSQSTPLVITAQKIAATSATASQSKIYSDAAVTALRTRSAGNDGKPLRDNREVDALAFSVSERISSSADHTAITHGKLSGGVARPHFE